MGRKRSPKEAFKRAKANGYRYRTHHEEGSKRVSATYVPTTIRDQVYASKRYEMWLASFNKEKHDEGAPFLDETDVPYTTGPQSLRAGLPPLDLATTKDVLRHYAVVSDGTLDPQ